MKKLSKKTDYYDEVKARIDLECQFIESSLVDLRIAKDDPAITSRQAYQILSNIMDSVVFMNHCFRFL